MAEREREPKKEDENYDFIVRPRPDAKPTFNVNGKEVPAQSIVTGNTEYWWPEGHPMPKWIEEIVEREAEVKDTIDKKREELEGEK